MENLFASCNGEIRHLFILQIVSAISSSIFAGWQLMEGFKMFSIFFTLIWVVVEGVAMGLMISLRR